MTRTILKDPIESVTSVVTRSESMLENKERSNVSIMTANGCWKRSYGTCSIIIEEYVVNVVECHGRSFPKTWAKCCKTKM